jgi:hypothetical protein
METYSTRNSGLLGNYITDLQVNPATNDLWIATSQGISKFNSRIGPPTNEIENVIAFPNPYLVRNDDDILMFNYNGRATARIFTVNGDLVWENDINIPWNGKNQQGEYVASGVYLFLLIDESGAVGKGKILLVKE